MTQLQKDYLEYQQGTRNYYYNTNDMEKAIKVQKEIDDYVALIEKENNQKNN